MSEKLYGACIIGQSGGPTAVINASAYGMIRTALDSPEISKVLGAAHGIKGVMTEQLYDMDAESESELSLLPHTPSSELGTCRYKMPDPEIDTIDYERILEVFKKHNVRYFFYNGGNDSMDTCEKISRYMSWAGWECRIAGVPKTIDNDLCGTDHSPGYGSAAKYIATSCAEVYKDACVYDMGTVVVMEMMGRHAGWLTAASSLASICGCAPDLIYLPEVNFDMDKFLADVARTKARRGSAIIAVSEGVHYADGSFVSEAKISDTDGFGHAQLGGLSARLAAVIKSRLGIKVRSIEFNLLQRCAAHCASKTDIDEALLAGSEAVRRAVAGSTGFMVGFRREYESGAYVCRTEEVPLSRVANHEQLMPVSWINAEKNWVTDDFIDYALPLIAGEPVRAMDRGIPRFARLNKVLIK